MTKKAKNDPPTTVYTEGRIFRRLQYFKQQNVLVVSLPNQQTTKLGFKKGDYIKVTNDGVKLTLEKVEI